MKYIGMVVTTPLIPRILDESKTMTRRMADVPALTLIEQCEIAAFGYSVKNIKSPYAIGDIIWVREEHYAWGSWEEMEGEFTPTGQIKWKFVADVQRHDGSLWRDTLCYSEAPPASFHTRISMQQGMYKRLARFMPKIYARTFLEITYVKLERLQDITEADAKLEGMTPNFTSITAARPEEFKTAHTAEFIKTINHLHGPDTWANNAWVWAITFKKTSKSAIWPA